MSACLAGRAGTVAFISKNTAEVWTGVLTGVHSNVYTKIHKIRNDDWKPALLVREARRRQAANDNNADQA